MVILMALMLFCGTIIKQEKVFHEINIAQRVHEPDNKTCIPSNAKIHTVGELGRTKNRMEKPTVDISRMYMYILTGIQPVNEYFVDDDELGPSRDNVLCARPVNLLLP